MMMTMMRVRRRRRRRSDDITRRLFNRVYKRSDDII
jgi:hypothetical protein